ncbi:MAG: hypothetical protein ACRCTJ_05095 [Brevinema sp.]
MTQQMISAITNKSIDTITTRHRTKNLVHFYRAVALFSMSVRSSELGLRRRK